MFVKGYGIIGFDIGDILSERETGDLCRLLSARATYAYIEYLTGPYADLTVYRDPYWHYKIDCVDRDFRLASEQEITALAQGNQESEQGKCQ